MCEAAEPATEEFTAIEEGKLLDYITGEPIKDTAKEQVRQRIARALFHEYGISVDDMQSDFPIKVEGRRRPEASRSPRPRRRGSVQAQAAK